MSSPTRPKSPRPSTPSRELATSTRNTSDAARLARRGQANEWAIQKALTWAYDHAVEGFPKAGVPSAIELANEYLHGPGTVQSKALSLVRWQAAKTAVTGFLSGLGGAVTLPASIAADLGLTWFVQLRMVAAVAYMGGHDPRSDRVRTMAYLTFVGDGMKEILAKAGVVIGKKVAHTVLKKKLPRAVLVGINRAVGFRLVTKFGEKGLVNLSKMLPLVGGFVGGTINASYTLAVGKQAIAIFLPRDSERTPASPRSSKPLGELGPPLDLVCPVGSAEVAVTPQDGTYTCPHCDEPIDVVSGTAEHAPMLVFECPSKGTEEFVAEVAGEWFDCAACKRDVTVVREGATIKLFHQLDVASPRQPPRRGEALCPVNGEEVTVDGEDGTYQCPLCKAPIEVSRGRAEHQPMLVYECPITGDDEYVEADADATFRCQGCRGDVMVYDVGDWLKVAHQLHLGD